MQPTIVGTPGGPVMVIFGEVRPGFEPVRDAFRENFTRRRELGGACCVYCRGEKVVDLWGGIRDPATGAPWDADTMVVVYSSTKGLAAMTLAVAHSRGWLDYEAPVASYWPEFAAQGKGVITVRQLLGHQAGLFALDRPLDRRLLADPDELARVLARQTPAWPPGARQGYHAITLGLYQGELFRRVDPTRRTLGRFFHEEIAIPLGAECYVRLPDSVPDSRLAPIVRPTPREMFFGFPLDFTLRTLNPRSRIRRTMAGSELVHDDRRIYARELESPSGGGVATARGIARAYGVFATGGRELELRPETLAALVAPASPPAHGFRDYCLGDEVQFSLGFMKPSRVWPFGTSAAFGSPGAGGSLGFADPATGIGYGYVTNRMGTALTGDSRDLALRRAVETVIRR